MANEQAPTPSSAEDFEKLREDAIKALQALKPEDHFLVYVRDQEFNRLITHASFLAYLHAAEWITSAAEKL